MSTSTLRPAAVKPASAARSARSSRSWVARGLMSVLAALGVVAATITPSQAWTVGSRANVPVLPTVYQVQGLHQNIGTPSSPQFMPRIYQPGPVASRTVPSGSQTVRITYTVHKWNGSSWTNVYSASGARTISSSVVSATLPYLDYAATSGAGYYSVTFSMVWTSPIGAVQGSLNASMSQSTDYRCVTTRTCSVGNGFIYLG